MAEEAFCVSKEADDIMVISVKEQSVCERV